MISVLFVDDEPDLLLLGKIVLEKNGEFSVVTSVSAVHAIQLLKKERFDAIISDFQMPGMNGIDLLRIVRKDHGDIPFILFTGRSCEEVVIEGINNGANCYLRKEGDSHRVFSELSEMIRRAVKADQRRTLRESEEWFRGIAERSPDLILIVDTLMNITYVSPSSRSLLGYEPEELIRMPQETAITTILSAGGSEFTNALQVTLSGRVIDDQEIRVRKKDGTWIFVSLHMIPILNHGDPVGVQVSIRDITRRKVTELALRESEEKFRRFAANAQDMLLRLSLPDRRYEYISPASVTMTGYTPEEFYADPTLLKRLIHPAWKDYFRKEWSALLEKKASPIYEYQIIDRSERVHWFNQRNVLVTGKNDEPVAIEGIVTDVTVRKEKERELIRREQRFQAVSHNAGSWIWEVDTRGIYTYSNLAVEEILGYRPDELVGKLHFYDLFDPSVRDALKAGALEIFDSRAPFFGFVNLNRHKNGDLVILKTSGAPVYSEEGVFAGYNGIDENITERRRIEETVRRANRQLNLLSSITRHDILNKISVLKGQIALIEMDNIDPVLSEHTMMMKRVTEQIQSLIAFTQLYQDLGSHDPRWIQLDTVMPVTFLPDGITLTCDLGNIIVFADAMFEKVFFNLLDNSVRHGQTTTGIRVSARETGDGLDIVWEDNGIGIPDSEKMLIFERGYGKNTGFGMFLVREILGLTGISIRETGIPGKGARFEMSVSEGMFRYQSDSDQTEA